MVDIWVARIKRSCSLDMAWNIRQLMDEAMDQGRTLRSTGFLGRRADFWSNICRIPCVFQQNLMVFDIFWYVWICFPRNYGWFFLEYFLFLICNLRWVVDSYFVIFVLQRLEGSNLCEPEIPFWEIIKHGWKIHNFSNFPIKTSYKNSFIGDFRASHVWYDSRVLTSIPLWHPMNFPWISHCIITMSPWKNTMKQFLPT